MNTLISTILITITVTVTVILMIIITILLIVVIVIIVITVGRPIFSTAPRSRPRRQTKGPQPSGHLFKL